MKIGIAVMMIIVTQKYIIIIVGIIIIVVILNTMILEEGMLYVDPSMLKIPKLWIWRSFISRFCE